MVRNRQRYKHHKAYFVFFFVLFYACFLPHEAKAGYYKSTCESNGVAASCSNYPNRINCDGGLTYIGSGCTRSNSNGGNWWEVITCTGTPNPCSTYTTETDCLYPAYGYGGGGGDEGHNYPRIECDWVTVWVHDASANSITDSVCNSLQMVTGSGGKAFAAFSIISVGIGFFTGKVSWGLMVGVAAGIGVIFGAPSLLSAISGEDVESDCSS